MIYTVLILHEENRQVAAHHINADTGEDALLEAAKTHGGTLIVAVHGECREVEHVSEEGEPGHLTFPGDCLVEAESYIELCQESEA